VVGVLKILVHTSSQKFNIQKFAVGSLRYQIYEPRAIWSTVFCHSIHNSRRTFIDIIISNILDLILKWVIKVNGTHPVD